MRGNFRFWHDSDALTSLANVRSLGVKRTRYRCASRTHSLAWLNHSRTTPRPSSSNLSSLGRLRYLDQSTGLNVIDIAVDSHRARHKRMRPDAPHVGRDALSLILDGQPIDELTFRGAWTAPDIMPTLCLKFRGVEALPQKRAHHLVGEGLHAAVGVVDHEPLICTEQLVRNDQRADGVVAGASTGVADNVSIPFCEPGELGGIEPRIHASQD